MASKLQIGQQFNVYKHIFNSGILKRITTLQERFNIDFAKENSH
jgi:hypothetical protein